MFISLLICLAQLKTEVQPTQCRRPNCLRRVSLWMYRTLLWYLKPPQTPPQTLVPWPAWSRHWLIWIKPVKRDKQAMHRRYVNHDLTSLSISLTFYYSNIWYFKRHCLFWVVTSKFKGHRNLLGKEHRSAVDVTKHCYVRYNPLWKCSFRERGNFSPNHLNLRKRSGLGHLKAHNFLQKECFFFLHIQSTSMENCTVFLYFIANVGKHQVRLLLFLYTLPVSLLCLFGTPLLVFCRWYRMEKHQCSRASIRLRTRSLKPLILLPKL